MKITCNNCGGTNHIDLKHDVINLILRKFRSKTKIILVMIVDSDGFIIASEADKYISKKLEHKIVALSKAMSYLAESGFNLIDCKNNIGRITYKEEDDFNINGFVMLIKSIIDSISIITIIPSWLNTHEILPDFEKTISYLTKVFEQDKSQKFSQFLSSDSDIKDSIYHNEYDMF